MNDIKQMREGAENLRWELAASDAHNCNMVAMRTECARAALRYVEHLESVGAHTISKVGAAPAEEAEPVARLQEEISDRPYSKGEKYFEVIILDRERCADGMELFTRAAPAAQPDEDKHLPGWERGIATVTLNGHQLREALEFIAPDGDAEQLDDELTFGIVQHKDDEGKTATGMCCWNDDTDGVLPLDSEPSAAPTTSQPAPQPDGWEIVDPDAKVDRLRKATQALLDAAIKHVAMREDSALATATSEADEALAACVGWVVATTTSQPDEARDAALAVELQGVAEELAEGGGFWQSCSGCHETEDGHPVGNYHYSHVFKCALGSGCSECGGIGAVWDNNDYEAMVRDLMREEAEARAPTAASPAQLQEQDQAGHMPPFAAPAGQHDEGIPAGFALVPIEPTNEMYLAACNSFFAWRYSNSSITPNDENFTHNDTYRAMIAAAPKVDAEVARRFRAPEGGGQAPEAANLLHPVQQQEQGDDGNDIFSPDQVTKLLATIKPGDGWGGDDWDFAVANTAARAALAQKGK